MGKRRKTAKTGDKAVYKGRTLPQKDDGGNNKHHPNIASVDPMYDEIDQFHNERDQDFIRLGQPDQENDIEDRDLTGNKEAVLDLGIGGSSSSSESSDEGEDINVDDDDDDDDGHSIDDPQAGKQAGSVDSESSDESSDSDSGSDDVDEGIDDLKEKIKEASGDARNWGKKISSYYHGDTADLEIGQQEEDAFLEEEAAKEIQAQRFQEMDEDDFVFSDDESNTMKTNTSSLASTKKQNLTEFAPDFSKLSTKEARKFLQHRHPELLPMVAYFADVTKDLKTRTEVATKALFDGEDSAESVGATLQGQEYLLTKAMLQKSIALNSVIFLLLKSTSSASDDGIDAIQAHPITDQLKSLYSALEKLEKKVIRKNNQINEQMNYLVKAAVLMNGNEAESGTESNPEDGSQDADSIESDENDAEKGSDDDDSMIQDGEGAQIPPMERQQQSVQRTLNEARFGLRLDEAKMPSTHTTMNRINDYVDPEEETPRSDVRMLASTINSIEQRVASRNRRPAPNVEQLDDLEEHDDRLGEGIKLMEAELGKLDNEDGDGTAGTDDAFMDDPDANDESLDFYQAVNKKTKSKKALRKSLYQVAPKFPRNEVEVDGERAINRTILKNRGLVAHKAKINRNPRVKKREQYRKALIRRKGAVREVRERESHNYSGEGTGIKSGISRSRKLSNKS